MRNRNVCLTPPQRVPGRPATGAVPHAGRPGDVPCQLPVCFGDGGAPGAQRGQAEAELSGNTITDIDSLQGSPKGRMWRLNLEKT